MQTLKEYGNILREPYLKEKNIGRIIAEGRKAIMMFEDFLQEHLKDENVKRGYDALEPEFQIIHAMLDARLAAGLNRTLKIEFVPKK